ncbi:hypothetical protein BpHYR1_004648 [Brachionus plicatilis]|uniref:Uncharacterized protein n=1 Tax=Brachionus plicatilis TaxID=10195 RepID=A0A3M7S7T8_BRAPC|nr:hypothetical protein BpHYR1_004648 [Brachionus plicatilis]
MQKLTLYLKSIISPQRSDEVCLLSRQNSQHITDSLYDFNEMTVDNHCSYQNSEATFNRGQSDNDLHAYSEKLNLNRINEYQAAWNITNAIQSLDLKILKKPLTWTFEKINHNLRSTKLKSVFEKFDFLGLQHIS